MPNDTNVKKIYRSDVIIGEILNSLNLTRESDSIYKTSETTDGKFLRLRISDHGVNMSSWYRTNAGSEIPLSDSTNVALTFLPNRSECEERGCSFPVKAINKTNVFIDKDSRTPIDKNFSITHYVYESWKFREKYVQMIISAINNFIMNGKYEDPLKNTSAKAVVFKNTSNIPGKKMIKENYISITEFDISEIVKDCVASIIKEREKPKTLYCDGVTFDLIDGDRMNMWFDSLPQYGCLNDIRMYFSKEMTICLFQRCDNGKYLFASIIPAPELGENETKFKLLSLKSIPKPIRLDAQSLIQRDRMGHKVLS